MSEGVDVRNEEAYLLSECVDGFSVTNHGSQKSGTEIASRVDGITCNAMFDC